ncbi:MAG TPA: PD-(D/E)XK nuclease family protein, partial [Desulfosarcina sp.]|nr:PD-(D/E)XK nuclease family protein [Desulfosarcina sp.]
IGPICRIVSPSIDQAGIHADDSSPDGGWHRVPAAQERTAHTAAAADPNPLRAPVIRLPEGDLLPAQTDFRDRKLSLESFSSILQRRAEKTPAAAGPLTSFDPAEKAAREADEPAGHPAATSGAAESVDALPGGVRMGSLFHHVFESIDFQSVVDGPADILDLDEVRQLVDSALALYRIERQWASRIAQVVADTLRMPIQLHGGSLVLCALPREHRRHEMEFYFPLTGRLAAGRGVPGCEVGNDPCGRMVLRGYIDLIFSWQGRYYIADWKSNRLTDGYHRAAMAHEMASAGYELQYRLYAIATLRWLKQLLGDRFIPQRHFGGALYFFIRGMDPEAQTGIFHVEPEHLLPLDSLEAAIQRQIAGR